MQEQNNNAPDPIEVKVHEEIKTKDIPPGGKDDYVATGEDMAKSLLEQRVEVASWFIPPHNIKSREVVDADIERVMKDGQKMLEMCIVGNGVYATASAIAHTQLTKDDPLRFFVFADGMIVINPVILSHTQAFVDRNEGCMSFPGELPKKVLRFNKITAKYQAIAIREKSGEKTYYLSPAVEVTYTGNISNVFQHECGHLNGCNIYDKDYSAYKSILKGVDNNNDRV